MLVDPDLIKKAKEKLGIQNAFQIAEILELQNFDEQKLKACCPFHDEQTPSFIYNAKGHFFHCFGACARNYDIVDALMLRKGMTYIEAVQELFKRADIKYAFGEVGVKVAHRYRYPKEVPDGDKTAVWAYLKKRGIDQATAELADIRQDEHGNIAFSYYDTNDVLCMVKYRPARKIKKESGEAKMWCQQGADTMPLLFNMNRVNTAAPLLITEGEVDCLAAIEAGFTNAVSVPFGAGNFTWIEHNWEFLEQFPQIIVASDNDPAGLAMRKEAIYRLGTWRTKFVDVPHCMESKSGKVVETKDLNDILYVGGKEALIGLVHNANEVPIESVVDYSDIEDVDLEDIDGVKLGIKEIDKELMRLYCGTLTIVTGVNGCVDRDTEFFNGNRWKSIASYELGDRVLQYNSDSSASLVDPLFYHKYPCDSFYHLQSGFGVDQCVSEEHNLVYITSKGNIQLKSVSEMLEQHNASLNGFSGKFITTFGYGGIGIDLSDEEIRVMCAVICDGTFSAKGSGIRCRINVKKQRKRDRLRMLLDAAKIPYKVCHYNPSDLEYETFLFDAPVATKAFGADWYQCSQQQLQIIAQEILLWDGSERNGRKAYSTSIKENADFVQFVFSATGQRSAISIQDRRGKMHSTGKYEYRSLEYTVSATDSIYPSLINTKSKINIPRVPSQDGFKYCFSVPSGMLVLRRNGRINITGNSGKTSLLSQLICQSLEQKKKIWLYSAELPNSQTKNWIDFILTGQRYLKEYRTEDDAVYYRVSPDVKARLREEYHGELFIYKEEFSRKISDILKSMEDNVRRNGTKLLIIDNLTAVNLECSDDGKYEKQTQFISDLIYFAKKYNVVVVLVVHPHKMDMTRRMNKMDIQGAMAISDLAHRVLSLYRVQESDHEGEMGRNGQWKKKPIKHDVILDILKDRMRGREGKSMGLFYDIPSRRFFTNEKELDYQYRWDADTKFTTPLPFPPPQLTDDADEILGNTKEGR